MTTVQGSLFGGPTQRIDLNPEEFEIACTVADLLRRCLHPKWRFSHFPAGEFRTEATGRRLKRMGVERGWPDFIILAPYGAAHFIELKRAKGRLSEPQKEFAAWCTENKIPHAIVRSFEEAVEVLTKWHALKVGIHA